MTWRLPGLSRGGLLTWVARGFVGRRRAFRSFITEMSVETSEGVEMARRSRRCDNRSWRVNFQHWISRRQERLAFGTHDSSRNDLAMTLISGMTDTARHDGLIRSSTVAGTAASRSASTFPSATAIQTPAGSGLLDSDDLSPGELWSILDEDLDKRGKKRGNQSTEDEEMAPTWKAGATSPSGGTSASLTSPESRIWIPSGFGREYFNQSLHHWRKDTLFTVVSYNVLSDDLMHQHRDSLYPGKCSPTPRDAPVILVPWTVLSFHSGKPSAVLAWEHRYPSLLQELKSFQPDVICLQEVQYNHFAMQFEKDLATAGYQGVYKQRTGSKTDGCAIFVNKSKVSNHARISYEKR